MQCLLTELKCCWIISHFFISLIVSISRMGHSYSWSQKSHQSNANHKPCQENHRTGSSQTPMGLRTYSATRTCRHINTKTAKHGSRWTVKIFSLFVSIATLYCGFHDAQTRDCGMPEEVQRQEETQGAFHGHTHTYSLKSNYTHAEVIFPLSPHRGPSSPPCLCHGTSLVSYSGMMQMEINFWMVLIDSWVDRCVCFLICLFCVCSYDSPGNRLCVFYIPTPSWCALLSVMCQRYTCFVFK